MSGRRSRTTRVAGISSERKRAASALADRPGAGSRLVSNITAGDYERLIGLLLAKPDDVLRRFPELQIGALGQLDGWDALKAAEPEAAGRIIAVAALHGIPEKVTDHGKLASGTDGEGSELLPCGSGLPCGGCDEADGDVVCSLSSEEGTA